MKIRVRPIWVIKEAHCLRRSIETTRELTPAEKEACWLVLGKPQPANPQWICDTDFLWPVVGVEGIGGGYEMLELGWVCRHMVQIGD